MKLIKYLPLLLLGMVFLKLDTSACEDRDAKKDNQKRKTEHLARSAYKALRASTAQKVDLHPDFMLSNSIIRF